MQRRRQGGARAPPQRHWLLSLLRHFVASGNGPAPCRVINTLFVVISVQQRYQPICRIRFQVEPLNSMTSFGPMDHMIPSAALRW